jgi:putative acetyltransferase
VIVEPASGPTPEVRELVDELERSLADEYTPDQRHGLPLDRLFEPHVTFFVARVEGVAVGCGGVACFATFAEVKRMYVRDRARGRGVARAMLARIETIVRERELDLLRLETGARQLAAIRLYERAGFQACAAFGDYAEMTPEAIELSRFYEKRLT